MTFISCKKEEEVKPVEQSQQKAQPFSGEAWLKQRVGNQAQAQQQPMQQTAQQSTPTLGTSSTNMRTRCRPLPRIASASTWAPAP